MTTSTVNPAIPVAGSSLSSAPVRSNFLAAYNDINALWAAIASIPAGGVTSFNTLTGAVTLAAGSNITLTPVGNTITIASSGGGGGGNANVIDSVSTDTTAAAVANTNYYYLCSSTMTLTLPTAVSNTNLYVIKNVGTGVVTIAFDGVETGDGQNTIVLDTQYRANQLISDDTNWNIVG